jgi:peptidoglycan-N-acetylglucosamine deacetylase
MSTRDRFLTISVDDGHPADWRAAEIIARHDLAATFYIPRYNPERPVIPEAEVRRLSEQFEIGAHTLHHRPLPGLPEATIREEVAGSKRWLEDVTGCGVLSFCYPCGKVDRRVAREVAAAGFAGARTCRLNLVTWPQDRMFWGVSTQAFSHSASVQIRHALLEGNLAGIWNFFALHRSACDWEQHFRTALDWVELRGGVAHLYLHGWEIDERRQWDKLERVLADAARRQGLRSLTNGELFKLREQ